MKNNLESTKINFERPKSKTKSELASEYLPDTILSTAVRILRRWIGQDPILLEVLEKMGYNKNCHLLTPIQVRTIHDHLGKP